MIGCERQRRGRRTNWSRLGNSGGTDRKGFGAGRGGDAAGGTGWSMEGDVNGSGGARKGTDGG